MGHGVGGWRSAALEVGGKGKIISDFGFRISNLKARSEVGGKGRGQRTEDSRQ